MGLQAWDIIQSEEMDFSIGPCVVHMFMSLQP